MLLNLFIQDLTQIYGQIVNFHQCVRKRQSFCQMQRLTNQRVKLTVEFTAKLFWVISIIASVMHSKNRIRFATDCKSDPVFQFETEFFLSPFLTNRRCFQKIVEIARILVYCCKQYTTGVVCVNDELDVKTGVTDTLPTVLAAAVSKSLMVVVVVGIISLAVVRCFG